MNKENIIELYTKLNKLQSDNFILQNKLSFVAGYLGFDKNPYLVALSSEIKELIEEINK
jgi:hypothetical protein